MPSDEETARASAQPTLRFLGAADTVTGSRYLLESGSTRVLIDCGLFQGLKVLRERNRASFPVPPGSIDAVVLTHAHLDHSGYIPALVRDGFRGRVYATEATMELAGVMLTDSGYLLEEEARHAASHRWSAHRNPPFRSTRRRMPSARLRDSTRFDSTTPWRWRPTSRSASLPPGTSSAPRESTRAWVGPHCTSRVTSAAAPTR